MLSFRAHLVGGAEVEEEELLPEGHRGEELRQAVPQLRRHWIKCICKSSLFRAYVFMNFESDINVQIKLI